VVRSDSNKSLDAHVIQLINEYEVAFSLGSAGGVRLGDGAEVFELHEIADGKEVLGTYRRRIARFRIIAVEERFSIGRITDTVVKSGMQAIIGAAFEERALLSLTDQRTLANDRRVFIRNGALVSITRGAATS
jgi:hypothetical protein